MKRILFALLVPFACAAWAESARVSLDGEWTLDYFLQPERGAVRSLPLKVPHKTVKATVPGNCELDLANAGLLPPAEIGLNALAYRPYEEYQWLYTKTFDAPAVDADGGERAVLEFGGIDTLADVFLNGERIGACENMLIPCTFDVTDRIRKGENTVQVLIRSVTVEAQDMTVGELGFNLGFGDREPFRKAAHMGGWDIFPRLYVSGLWRSVAFEVKPAWRVDETAWFLRDDFDIRRRCGGVEFQFRAQGPRGGFASDCTYRASLARNGRTVAELRAPLYASHVRSTIHLKDADLWWPRGMGESALYDATVEIFAKDGRPLAKHAEKFGVRMVRLERDDVYGKDRPGQFLFVVNEEPCYIRGSNWVPLDSFHGRDGQFIRPTLELLADLNCNMVRVWGGGVYEPEEFFAWCDENGLMVWQDFMTGCSVFPQDDRYAKLTETEVKSVVIRFRNHPSIVLWSGNNENDNSFCWDQGKYGRDPNRDRLSRKTIPAVLFEYDRTRPYLPSSPYVSSDVFAGRARLSEDHLWGVREYYKVPYYTNSPAWFASEMGYHGCTGRASLEKMMTKDCVYPWRKITGKDPKADFDWNDEWRLKASSPFNDKTNWLNERNNLMTKQVDIMFGSVPHDLDTFIAQSQLVQAEAMKTFCELFRSRKFTRFNGLIWWNVRDGWPQISDAVVDYYGSRKPAYFALKNAQKDQFVCLTDDHTAWAVNDARRPVEGHAKFTDKVSGRCLLACDFEIAANGKTMIGTVPFAGKGLILIEATLDGKPFRNHFLYGEPPFSWAEVKSWMPDYADEASR